MALCPLLTASRCGCLLGLDSLLGHVPVFEKPTDICPEDGSLVSRWTSTSWRNMPWYFPCGEVRSLPFDHECCPQPYHQGQSLRVCQEAAGQKLHDIVTAPVHSNSPVPSHVTFYIFSCCAL